MLPYKMIAFVHCLILFWDTNKIKQKDFCISKKHMWLFVRTFYH